MPPDDSPTSDRRSVLKAAGALGAFLGSSGVAAADGDEADAGATELLVGVSPDVSDVESAVDSSLVDGRVVHTNEAIHYATIELPENTPEEAKAAIEDALASVDEIEYVEENATIESFAAPNDPYYGSQHAPQQVNCEGAWAETLGDSDVTISIVDTGTAYDHENLAENVDDRIGEVFVGGGSDPYPRSGSETHGTMVSGAAVGATDNGTGHAGISNCSMLSARALDASGTGSLADIADAVQWSADQGVDVINLSLGSSSDWYTLRNACQYAYDQGCLLVAAAGNSGGSVAYPAVYDSVIAVSALDSYDRLASFSNRGSEIELAAPGTSIVTTTLNDGYTRASGTSIASPIVAGVAGLVLSEYPDLDVETLRDHLRQTATDVGLSAAAQGYGRVDADAAVNTVPDGYEPENPDDGGDDDEEDDTENPGIDDVWNDDESNHVELEGGSLDRVAEYRIAGRGTAEPGENANTDSDDPYRDIVTTDGEEFVVEGYLGGYVDDFHITGAVTDVETNVNLTAVVNGHAFDLRDLEGVGDWEDDDGEPQCGDETVTASAEGSLSGRWWGGTDSYTYSLRTADPCSATVALDGPDGADFDLYVTLDGRSPSRWDYDESSDSSESDESITVDLEGDEELRLQVHANSGSGEYELTVEERGR
ncbi:serine protease [Halobiforma haloterrestris]|uniref:Serine protease n=1 Tax=Natronobacterium haloterrestre TaxID=148448 RepID=A0A1I1JRF2_NATHA|nr:S8 family serine peptidase [Halobiforma haloterrestris]SFC47950.1 serine protease [Halobiforma haloterrestris]